MVKVATEAQQVSVDNINEITKVTRTDDTGLTVDIASLALVDNGVFAQTKPLDFGDPRRDKYIDGVRCDLYGDSIPTKLFIKLGMQEELDDAIVWTDAQYFTSLDQLFDFRLTTRFLTFYIEDESPLTLWSLSSIEFYGRVMKGRR